ncbi:ComEC/Rec2 family competence protein [Paenibacillus tundrae]|uniref:ComEC/Rec2 family competence protein n=1 Tax=Paenibacillus tundrae TaxID=528187 RepID=UPI0030D5B362
MSIHVKVLPATYGDSIIVTLVNDLKEKRNILIDGGVGWSSYKSLKNEIELICGRGEEIDLLVVTHIDEDHISGIIELFEDSDINKQIFKEIWFNTGQNVAELFGEVWDESRGYPIADTRKIEKSITDGVIFESLIENLEMWKNDLWYFQKDAIIERFGAEIKILSPSKLGLEKLHKEWTYEKNSNVKMSRPCSTDYHLPLSELIKKKYSKDRSIPNLSSISLLIKFQEDNVLLLGDSHAETIVESLTVLGYTTQDKLQVALTKVSHHGSKRNTSDDLLSLIDCKNFVISTDGSSHCLPNKETIARIISSQPDCNIIFNYRIPGIFLDDDLKSFNFTYEYLEDKQYTFVIGEDEV